MIEELSAALVLGGAIKMFRIRFFVVAAQHGKQGEPSESHEGFDGYTLIPQHLEQQAEVVGEGRLLGQQKQQLGFEDFFDGLLDVKAPALFLED
jgi:hypothetical protein